MADARDTTGRIAKSESTKFSMLTEEDSLNIRRVRDDIPKRLWVVAFIGFWERAAFWGLTAPWQNYMQHPFPLNPGDTPGALGLGQVKATRIYCAFYIGYYVSPLAFAFISDNHIGRYKTLLISLVLYNLGCAILTVTSIPSFLEKGWGIIGLALAMTCIALGGGGFQTVMAAFLADQYTEAQPHLKTLKSGEQVITDRSLTLQYIYNLYYWLGNIGSLSWFATVALEKNVHFTCAYGLTLCFLLIAILQLLLGRMWYVKVPHEANVISRATKILLCASRNGFKIARADLAYQREHHGKTVSWNGKLVRELCHGLRACRVLIAFVVFFICFDQMQNNLISQTSQMETRGTPNDMLPAMNQVGCIIFVPLIQHVLYPFLHRRKIYMKPITRIAIGFGFVTLSMLYAAIVQYLIYSTGPCFDHPKNCNPLSTITADSKSLGADQQQPGRIFRGPNYINVWIQAPIYFFIAIGEIFALVTAIEYAYSHAPTDMKAIIQAINLLLAGVGSACAMGLSPFAHDPDLVIFYASIASAMAATTIVFWLIFHRYDKIDTNRFGVASDETLTPEVAKDDSFPNESSMTVQGWDLSSLKVNDSKERDLERAIPRNKTKIISNELQEKTEMPSEVSPVMPQPVASETSIEEASEYGESIRIERPFPNAEYEPQDESEIGRWENPRRVPPIPSWRPSKGLLKETAMRSSNLGIDVQDWASECHSLKASGEDDLQPSGLEETDASTHETTPQLSASLDKQLPVIPANVAPEPQDNEELITSPGVDLHPVPALVAHFEELSRSSSEASAKQSSRVPLDNDRRRSS